MYKIGEVAKLLGVSSHTLRYYEEEQIILPERNEHGEPCWMRHHACFHSPNQLSFSIH